MAALAGAPGQLLRATEDFLHQSYRSPAMPDSLALITRLRARGVPAVISGAGPTVLALVTDDSTAEAVLEAVPSGWSAMRQTLREDGARVLI